MLFFDDEEELTPTNKVVVKIGLMLVEQRLQRGKIKKRLYLSSNVHVSPAGLWHWILGNNI